MKSQADIVGLVLIVLISIGLLSLAYTWGMPLIQKKQDTSKYERIFKIFDPNNPNSLERKIVYVANSESSEIFSSDYDGTWIIDPNENSISFSFVSKVTGISPKNEWYSLLPNKDCSNPSSQEGILGSDESFIVCTKAKSLGDSFEITFKIWFINLTDPISGKKYLIHIYPESLNASVTKTLKLEYSSAYETSEIRKTNVGIVLL
ncbi:MAG: hypothetical protein B6U78_02120 [Candidatus Aenigmarchaeota archaeon ex4484_224]|nr:MAG: hypothetical protein B6U78_02120 [Candidatus Aenigmarchaeota archaeon ex4484_224]